MRVPRGPKPPIGQKPAPPGDGSPPPHPGPSPYSIPSSEAAPSTLEQTAIHEAGHAVIATLIHRGMVEEVFISDHPLAIGGFFDEVNISDYGLMGGTRFGKVKTTLLEQGLIAYSGFFAQCEQLFQKGIDLDPLLPQLRAQASHDVDRYLFALEKENLPEGEIEGIVIGVGSLLKHYFDNGVWERVETVAAALLARRQLTGKELLELLPEFGRPPEPPPPREELAAPLG